MNSMSTVDYRMMDMLSEAIVYSESGNDLITRLRFIRKESKRLGAENARAETEIALKGKYRSVYADYLWLVREHCRLRRRRNTHRQLHQAV